MLTGFRSRQHLVWAGFAALLVTLTAIFPSQTASAVADMRSATAAGPQTSNDRLEAVENQGHPDSDDLAIPPDSPLIMIGVGGLIWQNITPEDTPTLWNLLEDPATSAGAITVYTVGQPVCPAGGWLALSAGRPTPSPQLGSLCVDPYRTRPVGAGGHIVDWAQAKKTVAATSYEPKLGTLGEMLASNDIESAAIGPGAALTLADETGWVSDFSRTITPDSFEKQLTVVDVGSTSAEDLSGRSLRVVDERIRRVLAQAPDNAAVLVTSVSVPEGGKLQLGVAMLRSPGVEDGHYLTSTATRWDGVVRLLDLPLTIAELNDIPWPADFSGAPLRLGSERPDAAETVETLASISTKDLSLRAVSGSMSGFLELSTFVLVLIFIWRPWDSRHTSWAKVAERLGNSSRQWVRKFYGRWRAFREWASSTLKMRQVFKALKAQARLVRFGRRLGIFIVLFFAALPVSFYLMGAVPWWEFSDPSLGAWLTLIVISAALGLIIAAVPWRSSWQAIGVISLISAAVMGIDVIFGSELHRGSPIGRPSPIYGARFYGIGNATYSFFVVHTLVFAAVAATPLIRAGRKFWSYIVIGGIGAVAVIIDVAPTWGADVGGGLALIPAFAFLAMAINRARFTILRVLLIGGFTAGSILGFAFLDWLRPAARRSHAGQFFEQLITGDAWQIIWRKAIAAFNRLDTGLASRLTLILLVFALLALIKPDWFAPAAVRATFSEVEPLRSTLGAILVGIIAGAALNDFGLRIVTLGFATIVPLLALMTVRGALPRAKILDE